MTLLKTLTTNQIKRWAGSRAYGRGEAYYQDERVRNLRERRGKIAATVRGTHSYHVRLWEDGKTIDYDCDCPVGLGGDFCKHCVAVALAWLEKQAPAGKTARRRQPKQAEADLTMKDVRAWLLLQEREALADMLLEAAVEDEQLVDRLMLKAAAARGVNLDAYRKIIDQAIGSDGFIDYYAMPDYYRGMDGAIDAIDELLAQGHAAAVIELSEYALQRTTRAIETVEDSDGYMSLLLERLQALHLSACRKAKPDQEVLAERLFRWELSGDWDVFHGAIKSYTQVLGMRGREHYRALAEAEWAKVRSLKPGENDQSRYCRRFYITSIMESLAEQSGDIEALVQVKSQDLSSSYAFYQIAEIYRKARRSEQALEWAERGIQAFGDEADSRLQDLLADMYHRRKRHDEAMTLIWPQFEQRPYLSNYQKLKKHADRYKHWPHWRQRALDQLRAVIEPRVKKPPRGQRPYRPGSDRSRLVEIFLWEKEIEAAWQEAVEGGCSEELWLRLAGLREKEHPRDAVAIYQKLIGPIVERTNNDAYAEAAALLSRVEKLMGRLGDKAEFRHNLLQIREKYKRKRNFMKLLERFGK
ncbi:DUF6880 family protein [endosymbiont of Ridgeia piscesae]|jgi:uncharacterized Zn finger protein|uniref:Putative conserved protein, contains Zn finger domain n=1 Tax=endosymbiont of Ridgeia piscesae TaxID=54398 RepID=A0A0T5Z8G5_9GAMM|nr:DUF6880 family protein [endosymbiont of Ridgeia piscesae]KRT54849.1 hypothetical protein Ga0074115_11064 [endosymbiont of Ridgeia piscesae]KRT59202.1 putative conserved protein, contains Zn finger domain [endosymbiont of Ridgeia piscesae]